MQTPEPHFLDVSDAGGDARRIAFIEESRGDTARPGVVWLCGFNSVMTSTKVSALAEWAERKERSLLRFDYSGHGASDGSFEEGTIGQWLQEAVAVLRHGAPGPKILVGSSMGGWIALLILRAIARGDADAQGLPPVAGTVLIAPAWDMTEELMWKRFPDDVREAVEQQGVYLRPSAYGDGPYPITRALIEDGRRYLIKETPFDPGCPVRILQGLNDTDVPWEHASALNTILTSSDIDTVFVPDGDHRLSRDEDIAKLIETIETLG